MLGKFGSTIKTVSRFLITLFLVCLIEADEVGELKEALLHRLDCDLGLETRNCPVDGGWSPWSVWGPCIGECGQVGIKTRRRNCNNPPPANKGAPCQGLDFETKDCFLMGCAQKDYEALAKCDPLRARELEILKKVHVNVPSLVDKCFLAECQFTFVHERLHDYADRYWNALHCVKHNIGCPAVGGWSDWGQWSKCSAECGYGSQMRCRSCDNPIPSAVEYNCTGENCAYQTCIGNDCESVAGFSWLEWSDWSGCSKSCGVGLMRRVRHCANKRTPTTTESAKEEPVPSMGTCTKPTEPVLTCSNDTDEEDTETTTLKSKVRSGQGSHHVICSGPIQEIKPCYLSNCPVDGSWSDWEPWSGCSVGCGMGVEWRNRACSQPEAMFGGIPCPGPITAIRHCFHTPCPGKMHEVSVFGGDGYLSYSSAGKPSRLLHLFLRFRPISQCGQLLRRTSDSCRDGGGETCKEIKLFLEAGYLGFTASLPGASLSLVTQHRLKMSEWHTALIMLTGWGVKMRVDDSEDIYRAAWIPHVHFQLPDMDLPMTVGSKFTGQIEQMAVNFRPVQLVVPEKPFTVEKPLGLYPYSRTSVIYETSEVRESYRDLSLLIHAPCPNDPNKWMIEMAVKPETVDGYLMVMKGEAASNYMVLSLDSNRVWLTVAADDCGWEASAAQQIQSGEWFNFQVDRTEVDFGLSVNGGHRRDIKQSVEADCDIKCRELFIGNVKQELVEAGAIEEMCGDSLPGVLGYLKIDEQVIQLETLPTTQISHKRFTAETISYSDNYAEIEIKSGEQLNITCVFDKNLNSEREIDWIQRVRPLWLHFDTPIEITNETRGTKYDAVADDHEMRLTSWWNLTREEMESFYSCWVQNSDQGQRVGKVLYTYGIVVVNSFYETLDFPTYVMIAVDVLLILLLTFLMLWILYELNEDYKQGSGLFRRATVVKSLNPRHLSAILHSPETKKRLELFPRPKVSAKRKKKSELRTKKKSATPAKSSHEPVKTDN